MSLSTAITLALLLKKLTRKGTISRRAFRPAKKTPATNNDDDDDDDETSSLSSEEKLEFDKRASMSEKLPDATHVEICEKKPAVQASPTSSIKTASTIAEDSETVIVRDFAYSESSPLHHGRPAEERRLSQISLSSDEFTGRQARALYDFTPETEYEIGMKAGEVLWVQYRQCPGWLIADVMDETGLIPESYVEFI